MIPIYKPYITEEEINSVVEVLKSGWLSIGPKTQEFEEKFKEYVGCKYAISVSSCTAGLFLTLKALNIKEGDKVIVPVFTFAATANVVEHVNATPIFVDIEEEYYQIDYEQVKKMLEEDDKIKAIIVVDYAGNPVDLDKFTKLAKEYQVYLIEDAAHSVGAEYKGRKVGSYKDIITVFSFYPTKPMTTGEGGMVCVDDKEVANRIKILRMHGLSKEAWKRYLGGSWAYDVLIPGYKLHMTDIQAAIGLVQLKKLDWMNEKRKEIAYYYIEKLKDLENEEKIILPKERQNCKSTWHIFAIRLLKYDRDDFIEKMKQYDVGTSVHFIPIHYFTYYKEKYKLSKGQFPVAEEVFKQIVSLPIYPSLTKKDQDYIIQKIYKILK